MSNNPNKDYTQLHIRASEHPKAYAPHILILNIVMSVLGAIIGLELIVRTGVAPQHLNCRSAVCDHYIAYSHCNPEKVSEYSLPESDSDIHLRSNLFSSKLLPSSHWCSGYYGKNGSDVPDADRFFSGNHY